MRPLTKPAPPRSGPEAAIRAAENQGRRLVAMLERGGHREACPNAWQAVIELGKARLALRPQTKRRA